jgi:hypothetical protein
MEPIVITQAEALLIGCCLGEYENRKEHEPDLSFLNISSSRLGPFVPEMTHQRRSPIKEEDFPADIEWLPIGDMRVGTSVSNPNVFFGTDEQGAFQKRVDHSQKNLVAWLTAYLLEYLGMDEDMRQFTRNHFADHLDVSKQAASLVEMALNREDLDPANFGIKGESDDVNGIKQAIEELIRYNRFDRPFQIGCNFGQVVAALNLYEKDISSLMFMAMFGQAMGKLYQLPEIADSTFASSALRKISAFFDEEFEATKPLFKALQENMELVKEALETAKQEEETSDEDDSQSGIELEDYRKKEAQRRKRILPRISQARTMIWVAFGDVLGFLRQLPDDVENREALIYRPFQLMKNDSPDRIRESIRLAERQLYRPSPHGGSPESLVNGLGNAIEGLTKRLWPKDYQKKGRNDLPGLYMDKIRDGNCLIREQRFASTALTLYKMYRLPAVHEVDSFQCTFAEARYFVAGVRMLWELYDTIKKSTQGHS